MSVVEFDETLDSASPSGPGGERADLMVGAELGFAGMAQVASALEPYTTGSELPQLVSQAATDQGSPAELKRSRTDQFRSSAQVSTHGNVMEWCRDWWSDRYCATSPLDDPPGASGGSDRVRRGGTWGMDSDASECRAAYRHGGPPGNGNELVSFRLTRTVFLPDSSAALPKQGTDSPP